VSNVQTLPEDDVQTGGVDQSAAQAAGSSNPATVSTSHQNSHLRASLSERAQRAAVAVSGTSADDEMEDDTDTDICLVPSSSKKMCNGTDKASAPNSSSSKKSDDDTDIGNAAAPGSSSKQRKQTPMRSVRTSTDTNAKVRVQPSYYISICYTFILCSS
jgi:hypothetical protein